MRVNNRGVAKKRVLVGRRNFRLKQERVVVCGGFFLPGRGFWVGGFFTPKGEHHALCPRCVKSRLFFTTSSHRSQGPEFCTLQPLLVHWGFFVQV